MATTPEVRRCTRIRSAPLRPHMFSDHAPGKPGGKASVEEACQRLDINVRKRPDSLRLQCHAWSASEEEHAGFGQ